MLISFGKQLMPISVRFGRSRLKVINNEFILINNSKYRIYASPVVLDTDDFQISRFVRINGGSNEKYFGYYVLDDKDCLSYVAPLDTDDRLISYVYNTIRPLNTDTFSTLQKGQLYNDFLLEFYQTHKITLDEFDLYFDTEIPFKYLIYCILAYKLGTEKHSFKVGDKVFNLSRYARVTNYFETNRGFIIAVKGVVEDVYFIPNAIIKKFESGYDFTKHLEENPTILCTRNPNNILDTKEVTKLVLRGASQEKEGTVRLKNFKWGTLKLKPSIQYIFDDCDIDKLIFPENGEAVVISVQNLQVREVYCYNKANIRTLMLSDSHVTYKTLYTNFNCLYLDTFSCVYSGSKNIKVQSILKVHVDLTQDDIALLSRMKNLDREGIVADVIDKFIKANT